jgi:CheY-like chemotaxis protein
MKLSSKWGTNSSDCGKKLLAAWDMNDQLPLILAVADLAYSGGEMFKLLGLCLSKADIKTDLQSVPLAEVLETTRRLQPALIIIGHRPLLEDTTMRKNWEAAGFPMGCDIVKILKANPDTSHIPVLMLEAVDERVAWECGADAFVQLPAGPEIAEAIRSLIGKSAVSGG